MPFNNAHEGSGKMRLPPFTLCGLFFQPIREQLNIEAANRAKSLTKGNDK